MSRIESASEIPSNRAQRRRMSRRRAGGIVGASLFATTGLLGGYLGNPRLPRAYAVAVAPCATAVDEATLLGAIADVNEGDCNQIEIAATTITLTGSLPMITGHAQYEFEVNIVGAGQGRTTIDGDGTYSGWWLSAESNDLTVHLSDMTITKTNSYDRYDTGVSTLVSLYSNGGAVYGVAYANTGESHSLDLSVADVTFSANYAEASSAGYDGSGAAIYVSDSANNCPGSCYADLTVTDSTFLENESQANGGAIGGYTAESVTVTGSTFSQNSGASGGGAVYLAANGTLDITTSTFTGNGVDNGNGGAVSADGALTITYSAFSNNSAGDPAVLVSAESDGGAVYAGSTASITYSTFDGNHSFGDGGALYSLGLATIANSTFTGNFTDYYTDSSSEYHYYDGGAISLVQGGSIDFSTVVGNGRDVSGTLATSSGGGVYTSGALAVENSIFWGNIADNGDDIAEATTGDVTAGFSIFSAVGSYPVQSASTNLPGQDPLLEALGNNGGPTLTLMPRSGSPAIAAADPAVASPSLDQRGYRRSGRFTMGAVQPNAVRPAPNLSQLPPSWHQATLRQAADESCPEGMNPSWAQWPNEGTGGWTCEMTTWWDVNKGTKGGWVTSPGFRKLTLPGSSSWEAFRK